MTQDDHIIDTSVATEPADTATSTFISTEPPRRSFLARFLRWEWLLVLLILLVVAIFSRLSPYFLNANNLFRTSSDFMEMGLMMLPMTFIIISANIDLSVASALGMTASFMGFLFNHGINIWVAAAGALLLGTAGGLLNGFLVAYVRLPALVVTLGTFAFYRGIAFVLLGDQAARGYPRAFTYIGQGKIFGTPMPFSMLLFIVLAIVFGLILHKTTFGRYLYSIGNNEDACLYSGVPVAKVKLTIFALSVITATVLGGIDIFGGSGTMIGAVLSLVLIGLMRFGMGLMNIQGQVQSIAIGLLLILSILLPNVTRKVSTGSFSFDRTTVFAFVAAIIVAVLFGWFFFWSRTPILVG